MKKLPVEVGVPKLMATWAMLAEATKKDEAVGDCALIAFYYLLRIGQYMIKGSCDNTRQTKQFKWEDITFFRKNVVCQIRQLLRQAPYEEIFTAHSATMKLDN